MTTIVSMFRGINLAKYNRVKMEDLRQLYESLGFEAPKTFIQSGNVVFKTRDRNLAGLTRRIENAFEKRFEFHSDVFLRTTSDLREVIANNPFAGRADIQPNRLLVTFLAREPAREGREKLLAINTDPEESRIEGREIYTYYPNGMARPKLSWAVVERMLQTSGTSRNWNSVLKLLEIAETL